MVDGFVVSNANNEGHNIKQNDESNTNQNIHNKESTADDYNTDDTLVQQALADYDFTLTNNEDIVTTEASSDNEVDSDVIVDVIKNFISEQDPILELFLSVCFVHPDCFQV